MPDPLIPKSSPPRLIAICQHPHGDGLWFESEPGREPCHIVGCDCVPARYVLAEVTDEMVERVAVGMVGNGDPDYWRCLSEPQKEWHRGRARRALDAAFRIGDEPPRLSRATNGEQPNG